MRNLLYVILVAIVLVISATGLVLAQNAQNNTQVQTTLDSNDVYTIVTGDSLAALSPTKWKELKAMNPFLNEPGRTQVRSDGWVRVLIYPGERIVGLKSLGIGIVKGSLQSEPPTNPEQPKNPETGNKNETVTDSESFLSSVFRWALMLISLLLALALAYVLYLLWLLTNRANASTAGPKYVADGLTHKTAHLEFLRQAQENFGTGTAPMDSFRISNQRWRRAVGIVRVGFKNGKTGTHILKNEGVYLADVEYPDGTVRRDEMLLSACGNPLRRSGNVASYAPGFGFRFTDEQPQVVRIPEPEAEVETVQPRRGAAETRDGVFFTEDGSGAIVELKGKTVEFSITPDTSFQLGEEKSVTVRRNWVLLKIENGRITNFGLDGEPKKVVPLEQTTPTEEAEPKVDIATNAQ